MSIELNGFDRVADADDPKRFLNYRIWQMAVAVLLSQRKQDSEFPWPTHYIAICLLNDIRDFGDPTCKSLFGDLAADVAKQSFTWTYPEPESVFWNAAEMVWAYRQDDHDRVATAAARLIEQENEFADSRDNPGGFLFGLTNYDQRHREWKDTLRELTNPLANETVQLVLETLDLTNRRKLPYQR